MAPVHITIDKFGRKKSGRNAVVVRGPPGVGFKITSDEQYDIGGKRLKNIGEPADNQDGATRNYVDKNIEKCIKDTRKAALSAADMINTRLFKYADEKKTKLKEEYNKRITELKEQIMSNVNEHSTLINKRIDILTEQMHKYLEENKTEFETKYYELLNKRMEEVTDTLRIYVNGLNIVTMRENDIIRERVAVVEQDIKKLFEMM